MNQSSSRLWTKCLSFALSLLTVAILAGCGGEEKAEPAAPESTSVPAPEATAEAIPPPLMPIPEDAPLVLDPLRLMPASAQIAVGLPPLQSLLDKALPFASQVAGSPELVDMMLQSWVQQAGMQVGAPDAKTPEDVANALGLNINGPMAIFVDLKPTVASAVENAQEMVPQPESPAASSERQDTETEVTAEEPAEEEAAADAPEAEASEDVAEDAQESGENLEEGTEEEPGENAGPLEEGAPDFMESTEPEMQFEMEELDQPKFVAVLPIIDFEKAQASVDKVIANDPALQATTAEKVDADGIAITVNDPEKLAYFFEGDKLVMSNNLDLLKESAARVRKPETFRFGTASAPALAQDQAVLLAYGQRMLPLVDMAAPLVETAGEARQAVQTQIDSFKKMLQTADGKDDPVIMDLAWTEDRLTIQSRMDTKTHPAVLEMSGPAAPLKLAQLLPETTLALLSLRLTPVAKQQLNEMMQGAATMDENAAMGVGMARQVVDIVEDELTIGVASGAEGFPSLFVLVSLANPEATKNLLDMFVPSEPTTTYNEVPILSLMVPTPVPVYLAMPDKLLIASNSLEGLQSIIDLQKQGGTSGLFAKLEPPLDAAAPRYSALLLNSRLVSEVLLPLSALTGGLGGADTTAQGVANNVKEVRMISGMDADWMVSKLEVFLNKPGAGAPAEAPAPAGAQ